MLEGISQIFWIHHTSRLLPRRALLPKSTPSVKMFSFYCSRSLVIFFFFWQWRSSIYKSLNPLRHGFFVWLLAVDCNNTPMGFMREVRVVSAGNYKILRSFVSVFSPLFISHFSILLELASLFSMSGCFLFLSFAQCIFRIPVKTLCVPS